ncbi:unnamed protein product, partial [Rotaria sordida]
MEYSCIELNDIPCEILLIIFQKLDNIDVLYSLHGLNKQLNKIIGDPIFTTSLNFVKWSSNKFINKLSSNVILNRFCLQILPDISIRIKWFHLESSSIKRILRAANYPNLYGLGLYNMKEKTARRLFTVQSFSQFVYLIDGRFNQLHTLIVDLINPAGSIEIIKNKTKIPNLKCFVLSCAWEMTYFDECCLPLLYRMSNLEKLGLYITTYVRDKFIDGNYLKNIFNRMPQLNEFSFDFRSLLFINNQINFLSNEDIQRTFTDF